MYIINDFHNSAHFWFYGMRAGYIRDAIACCLISIVAGHIHNQHV